jgi:hypothetical protein
LALGVGFSSALGSRLGRRFVRGEPHLSVVPELGLRLRLLLLLSVLVLLQPLLLLLLVESLLLQPLMLLGRKLGGLPLWLLVLLAAAQAKAVHQTASNLLGL